MHRGCISTGLEGRIVGYKIHEKEGEEVETIRASEAAK